MTNKKQNWFSRHKILTSVIGFLLLVVIISAVGGEGNNDAAYNTEQNKTEQTTTQTANPTESKPTIKVPSYKVEGTNKDRYDGAQSYLTTLQNFKGDYENAREYAKGIVVDLVSKNDKKISVLVFSNKAAHDAYIRKNDTDNPCFGQCLEDVNKILETGFIAWYSGFLDTGASEHDMAYFPATFKDNATVGKYVGSEEFIAENYTPAQ